MIPFSEELSKGVYMTYLDFEKEYLKDRPIEPYCANENPGDWAELAKYAEDNLQAAYNRGYCECFHKAEEIIKNLLECEGTCEDCKVTGNLCDKWIEKAENFLRGKL